MQTKTNLQNPMSALDWMNAAYTYWLDAGQRWILFMDILRKRGNNYFETIRKGEPPVLVFDYEVILQGRTFDRPVNYDLARIKPRPSDVIDPGARPIVVIDPRAGNGPGIGGSKRDSEIGDALAQGHPVYFILFHPSSLLYIMRLSLGLGVRPGILPRLAIGLPSTSCRSAVKSIGRAPLM